MAAAPEGLGYVIAQSIHATASDAPLNGSAKRMNGQGSPRTREDWDRGWGTLSRFSATDPSGITFETLDRWYSKWTAVKGIGEAGRAMKTWRALYNVMAAMKLCPANHDPSLAIRKTAVLGRTETWTEGEAVRLVKAHGGPDTTDWRALLRLHGIPAFSLETL